MDYLLKNFNIKTDKNKEEIIIYNNFNLDLSNSTIKTINNHYDKKIHIIFIGETKENNEINIINNKNQNILLTIKLINKINNNLNINIINCYKDSNIEANIFIQNNNKININILGEHKKNNTNIFINTKIYNLYRSETILNGKAFINKNIINCKSNLNFSALCSKSSKITFFPTQKIESIPKLADHSAFIYKAKQNQIEFLQENGLSKQKINNIIKEAFINN